MNDITQIREILDPFPYAIQKLSYNVTNLPAPPPRIVTLLMNVSMVSLEVGPNIFLIKACY
jgi:hypothetical protein